MLYQMVVDKQRARYNTLHMNLSLQSEVESLNLDGLIPRHQIRDKEEFLHRRVEYLDIITPQHVNDFHIESNKIRYLRNAVICKKWVLLL